MPVVSRITLGSPEPDIAAAFYAAAFSVPSAGDEPRTFDLHGHGALTSAAIDDLADRAATSPAVSGFRGYAISYLVEQPSEVDALATLVEAHGGEVMKPAKKGFFGGYATVVRTVDGSLWKIASEHKRSRGPAGTPPIPTEVGALLGVASPKTSKTFFTALGLTTDRDYGNKYIDFAVTAGTVRLGLLERGALAKDLGNEAGGSVFAALELTLTAESRDAVDALVTVVRGSGGTVTSAPTDTAGGYSGQFTDPDGYLWKIETR